MNYLPSTSFTILPGTEKSNRAVGEVMRRWSLTWEREDVEPTNRCRVVNCKVSSIATKASNEILTRPRAKVHRWNGLRSIRLFTNSIETTWFHPRLMEWTRTVVRPRHRPTKQRPTDRSGRWSSCVISHRRRVVAPQAGKTLTVRRIRAYVCTCVNVKHHHLRFTGISWIFRRG